MYALPHVATRVFGTPLAIAQSKLDVILAAIGDRVVLGGEMLRGPFEDSSKVAKTASQVGQIAVVPVVGLLVDRVVGMDAMSGMTSMADIADDFLAAITDPNTTGVLLEIDSPGGQLAAFDFADLIEQAKTETGKPVWAIASHQACSAGYLIASAADRILVTQTGDLGSIGVVMTHVDQSGADAKAGLKYSFIHAGAQKVAGNSHEALSDDVRSQAQIEVDKVYDEFVAVVARRRGMDAKAVRGTEAAIYRGQDAVQVGLADGLSTLRQALADMAALPKSGGKSARASSVRPPTVKGQTMDPKVQAGAGEVAPEPTVTDETMIATAVAEAVAKAGLGAEAIRAQCAELTDFAATAEKLGVKFDLATAIKDGVTLDAARKTVFDQMVAKQDETVVSTTPGKHPDHGGASGTSQAASPNANAIFAKRAASASGKSA